MNTKLNWQGRSVFFAQYELCAIDEFLRSSTVLTQGEKLEEFEEAVKNYLKTDNDVFAVTNCTNALDLIALLLNIKKRDQIIIPAHTFCATAIPFCRYKPNIKWADIDSETFVVDVNSIEKLITRKTKAIVVMHYAGFPTDMNSIMSIAERHNLKVVEDACHGPLSEYKGKNYYFCAVGCKKAFDQDPEKYLAEEKK